MKGSSTVEASAGEEALRVWALHTRERHCKEHLEVIEHSLGDLDSVVGGVEAEVALARDVAGVVIV